MDGKYLVTGAGGNVGSRVVEYLLAAGKTVIGAGRSPKARTEHENFSFRTFDFTSPDTWEACMDGVEYVFLMRPPHISKIRRDMEPFMRFMKERAVKHVIFMSVQGAGNNRMVPHHDVEQLCVSLALPFTFLRPSFFMQNLTTTHLVEIRDEKIVFTPTGRGKTNFVDVRDVGEVAARLLMDDSCIGKACTITGETSYSYGEIAERLTQGLDEPIRFADPGFIGFVAGSLKRGRNLKMTLVMLFLYSLVRFGRGDISTDDTETILGRRSRSLESFIADNRDLLKGS